jgi:hypothetical protein
MNNVYDDHANQLRYLLKREYEKLRYAEDYGTLEDVHTSRNKIKTLESELEEIDR